VLTHHRDGLGHLAPALVEVDGLPGVVLALSVLDRLVVTDRGGPWMREPLTGVTCGPGLPMAFHCPPLRLEMRSASNASGAIARALVDLVPGRAGLELESQGLLPVRGRSTRRSQTRARPAACSPSPSTSANMICT